MDEIRTRSLVLPDIRGGDRYMRITWHTASSTVVFSHWTGAVCTASTPVSLPEASRAIDLLVDALREVISDTPGSKTAQPSEISRASQVLDRFRSPQASIAGLRRRVRDEWRRRAAR
jgi:hypothetical protein